MSKININVIIKSNGEKIEENYLALRNNNKIIYQEKNCKTTIDLDEFKIKRENEESLLEMNFIPDKETNGRYLLKKENSLINLTILTDYLIIEDNLIILKYKVITTNQDVIFKLKM